MSAHLKLAPFILVLALPSVVMAELESIADGELSGVTAQGGLTIDFSGQTGMQQLRYEDSGEFVAEDIRSGGAGVTAAGNAAGFGQNFDDARLTLDIGSDGALDLLWQSRSGQPMDWGFAVGRVAVGTGTPGPRSAIFNDIEGWGRLLTSRTSILPPAVSGRGQSTINSYTAFTLENLSSSSTRDTIGIEGGYIRSPDFMGNSVNDMDLDEQIPAWAGAQRGRASSPIDDIRSGFAASETSVYQVQPGQNGFSDGVLALEIHGFAADVGAANMTVGNTNMGNMVLDNIQISDTIVTLTP